MAFRDSINDLMFRFYERFKQNNNRLPVSVDADINLGDVQIGTVKQGGVDEGAEPWKVRAEELEQKIDALKQSIESGVQLKGSDVALPTVVGNLSNKFALKGYPTPIVQPGESGDWDENIREIGNILMGAHPTHRYILLYSGHKTPYVGNEVYIGWASSQDGHTWTKRGKLTLGSDRVSEDPYMVKVGNTFYLYVEGKEEVPFRSIRLYTSTDFTTWTDQGPVLEPAGDGWESQDVSSPVVWVDRNVWYMLYEGRGANNTGAIGLATSSDGINWIRHFENPVVTGLLPVVDKPPTVNWVRNLVPDDVIRVGDQLFMTGHGSNNAPMMPIILVSRDNGVTWHDYFNGPLELPVLTNGGTVMFFRGLYGDALVFAEDGRGLIYKADVYGFRDAEVPVPVRSTQYVDRRVIVDRHELRDTTNAGTPYIDISRYAAIEFWVYSSLDQELRINFSVSPDGTVATSPVVWDPQTSNYARFTAESTPLKIPANSKTWTKVLDPFPGLQRPMLDRLRFRYWCNIAPTEGFVTVVMYGIPL